MIRLALSGSTVASFTTGGGNGQMPLRFKIGARAVGWRLSEINDWIAERAASHGEKS